jgi:hypothetical protein
VAHTKDSCEKQSARITRFRGNLFLKLPNLAKSSCAMLHHPNKKEKKKTLILCMLEFHLNTRDTIFKQEENLSCKNNLDNERQMSNSQSYA